MKSRLQAAPLTREDRLIWLKLNLPLRVKAPTPAPIAIYRLADRLDADLMLLLAECKALAGGGKAMAHRMLDSRINLTDTVWINGFWVNLA
jgi:hypothetical protein